MSSSKRPETAIDNRTVMARFCPTRLEDMRPEGWRHFGWHGRWQALWQIGDPSSPYYGQTMWWAPDGPWFGWVPDEDLIDVTEIASETSPE